MKSSQKSVIRLTKAEQSQLSQQTQFQRFNDEQFTNHRKSQLKCRSRIKQKSIKSLSVYTFANKAFADHLNNTVEPQPQSISRLTDAMQGFKQDLTGQFPRPRRTKGYRTRTNKQSTLQRYHGNEPSHLNEEKATEDQKEILKSSEKIGLIKKIIDIYNTKSIERTYYSNLINNLQVKQDNPDAQQKNQSLTIKKMPKNSFRKHFKKNIKNQIPNKINYLNMHGFDIAEEYYNHCSITLQAQGMNSLIKEFIEKKKISKSSQKNEMGKKRVKVKSNQQMPITKEMKLARKNIEKYQTLNQIKEKMLENMSDNSINHKVNKFRQFLFMVNFANHVYRELDIDKYDQPFKIYLGKGNNSNLIKSIMKKRFWFQTTKNREEANFVWTQLKQESVYLKQFQPRIGKGIDEQLSNENEGKLQAESTGHLKVVEGNAKLKETVKFMPKGRYKRQQFHCGQLKILTQQQNMEYNKLLGQFKIKKKYKFSDRVKYMKNMATVPSQQLKSTVIHNHLPLNGLLGNKKAMFYMLREYYRLTSQNIFNTVPLTYHIKKGLLDQEFKEFLKNNNSGKDKNYWIIKPGQFSNRGQGITCTDKVEDIKARIVSLRKLGRNKSLIIQKYITNPLLYNGRKFDIRTYMLLTVNNGKLRAYWYQDGYIRTSSSTWSLDNITDTFIHLTNDAIQKYSNNYGRYEPGNKLTYSELQRYLDSLPKNGKNYNFQTEIYPLLKQTATDAVRSTFSFIDPERKGNNFQIFGFDFMIDANFKPWLIEINTNPCLQMSCPVLERIIPSMVQNAFRISVDPIFSPPLNFSSVYRYNIPENALHYNKFQLIFDEDREGSQLKQLYANSHVVESIDQYEEDKETYQQQGQELNLIQT